MSGSAGAALTFHRDVHRLAAARPEALAWRLPIS
jgi:hypothetical protein